MSDNDSDSGDYLDMPPTVSNSYFDSADDAVAYLKAADSRTRTRAKAAAWLIAFGMTWALAVLLSYEAAHSAVSLAAAAFAWFVCVLLTYKAPGGTEWSKRAAERRQVRDLAKARRAAQRRYPGKIK